ncbi:MAG: hypothetical protein HYU39_06535 [Thaumarchaeota archaeon]|nr:hypothetical protein [Nitrososphaerota archaeon]
MRIYIDTSAYVKYYGGDEFEKGVSQVQNIIDETQDREHVLFSSHWLVPEAVATIDSWERKRYITRREKQRIYGRLVSEAVGWLVNGSLILIGVPHESYLRRDFLDVIADRHLSPGDALHLYRSC